MIKETGVSEQEARQSGQRLPPGGRGQPAGSTHFRFADSSHTIALGAAVAGVHERDRGAGRPAANGSKFCYGGNS